MRQVEVERRMKSREKRKMEGSLQRGKKANSLELLLHNIRRYVVRIHHLLHGLSLFCMVWAGPLGSG